MVFLGSLAFNSGVKREGIDLCLCSSAKSESFGLVTREEPPSRAELMISWLSWMGVTESGVDLMWVGEINTSENGRFVIRLETDSGFLRLMAWATLLTWSTNVPRRPSIWQIS